jgi:hypothetical protein
MDHVYSADSLADKNCIVTQEINAALLQSRSEAELGIQLR